MLWLVALIVKSLFCFLFLLWLYNQLTMGMFKSDKKLHGKVAIVTGGNAGIGFETAKDLAKRGAHVILGCRNLDKGRQAVDKIKFETANKKVDVMLIDMSSYESVRNFINLIKITVSQIDLLVNNAGMPPVPEGAKPLSKDEHDLVLQTNYFSQVLLTFGLKELLEKSSSPRVINISSLAQRGIYGNVDYYNAIKPGKIYPKADLVYGVSKMMLTTFTYELARQWANTPIQIYSLHPGFVRTEIFDKGNIRLRGLVTVFSYLLGKNVYQGTQTNLYCCLADDLINGEYYSDCRLATWYMKHRSVADPKEGKRLWDFTQNFLAPQLASLS